MIITGHKPGCLFVRDGGRSLCTCNQMMHSESLEAIRSTLNLMGQAVATLSGEVERYQEITVTVLHSLENRIMEHVSHSSAIAENQRTTLNVICEHQLKLEERWKAMAREIQDCSSADWLQARTLLELTNKRLKTIESALIFGIYAQPQPRKQKRHPAKRLR
jgi:hypothetical protein